ncbi:MAG: acyl-CoA dehydrogenase family protein [Bacillota bacterium]|nr:acyl-CoA dehydrogenase family protein [Bacillota bacterium]
MLDCLISIGEKELRDEARAFVREDVDRQLLQDMDADKIRYPREFLEKAAARNLLGLRFPVEYGGRGMPWTSEIVALEEIGILGTALGCLYSLVSIVGEAINCFGSEKLKTKYLRPTIEGRLTAAEALTEPRGGSDFFGAACTAVKDGDHYILNGQKRFVVGAEGADYFMVYARTDPEGPPHQSISAFLVDRGPGVKVEYLYDLMGTRGGGTGRLVFNDVVVPAENLLGEENGGGKIFYRMMIPERMTSAGGALGMSRAVLEIAARYSKHRQAFGTAIKNFQAVSFKIADSITLLDTARAIVYLAARSVDGGDPAGRSRRLVSEAKKVSTENAWKVVNNAMQVLGGIGYTSVYPIEKMLRDVRLIMIWTGTNEIMDLIVQHEYYKELAEENHNKRDIEMDAPAADMVDEKIYE